MKLPSRVKLSDRKEGKVDLETRPRTRNGVVLVVENTKRFVAVAIQGNQVAAIDEKGTLFLLRGTTYRVRRTEPCTHLAFALKSLVGARRSSLVFHLGDPDEVITRSGHKLPISYLESNDGSLLSVSADGTRLWQYTTKWIRKRYFPPPSPGKEIVTARLFRGDVVVLDSSATVRIYSSETGVELRQHTVRITRKPALACGDSIIVASGRLMYAFEDEIKERTLPVQVNSFIDAVDVTPKELLYLTDDGRIFGESSKVFQIRAPPTTSFAVDGDDLVLATSDGNLIFVDLRVARTKNIVTALPKTNVIEELPEDDDNEDLVEEEQKIEPQEEEEEQPSTTKKKNEPPKKKKTQPLWRMERMAAAQNSFLTPKRLQFLLEDEGSFPVKYRPLIWRMLLDLPEGDETFENLMTNEASPALESAEAANLMTREKKSLVTVVGALTSWCEVLGQAEWLPAAVYPVVKVFQRDATCAFETVLIIFGKIGRGWLACWPEAPLHLLACVGELTRLFCEAEHLGALREALFQRTMTPPKLWAWPMLRTFFSEVLPAETWLAVWDTIFTALSQSGEDAAASFFLLVPVAYAVTHASVVGAAMSQSDVIDWARRPSTQPFQKTFLMTWKRLASVCQGAATLKQLARGVPPMKLAEGLNAVAEDALERARAFPFPLMPPKDQPWLPRCYPELRTFPKVAVDLARQERDRVALEVARVQATERGVDAVKREAEKAASAARKLAAAEAASAVAEEAATERMKDAATRRAVILKEQRATAVAARLDLASKTEQRARVAMEATARRREASKQRCENEMKAAELAVEQAAEDARAWDRVTSLEAQAIERVAKLRDAAEREAEARAFEEDAASRARRLELEARMDQAKLAAEDEKRSARLKREDEEEAAEDARREAELTRFGTARAFLEAALRRDVAKADDARASLARRSEDEAARAARRSAKIRARETAETTANALFSAKEVADQRRERTLLEAQERTSKLDTATAEALDQRDREDRDHLATERMFHDRHVEAILRAATLEDTAIDARNEEALHLALAELDKEAAARRLRDAGRAADAASRAHRADAIAKLQDSRLGTIAQQRSHYSAVRDDLRQQARIEEAALKAALTQHAPSAAAAQTPPKQQQQSPPPVDRRPDLADLLSRSLEVPTPADDESTQFTNLASSLNNADETDLAVPSVQSPAATPNPPTSATSAADDRRAAAANLDELDALLSRARAVLDDAVFST